MPANPPRYLSAAAVPVAVVAIHAVVDISADTLMARIGLALGMAVCALEDLIIIRIRVARTAHSARATVIGREPGVVESCVQPAAGVVAGGAGRRKPDRNVVRIVGGLVVGFMTAVTVRRKRRVVVVHVAKRTSGVGVRPREWENIIVVEGRGRPRARAVADVALLREACGGVIWVIRGLIFLQVAGYACRVRQAVVVVDVTLRALQGRVSSGEGEASRVVIE